MAEEIAASVVGWQSKLQADEWFFVSLCEELVASLTLPARHSLPSTRSTAQHPRTCGPGPRQWSRMSALSHPAS